MQQSERLKLAGALEWPHINRPQPTNDGDVHGVLLFLSGQSPRLLRSKKVGIRRCSYASVRARRVSMPTAMTHATTCITISAATFAAVVPGLNPVISIRISGMSET